jgi:hypothetical protein
MREPVLPLSLADPAAVEDIACPPGPGLCPPAAAEWPPAPGVWPPAPGVWPPAPGGCESIGP